MTVTNWQKQYCVKWRNVLTSGSLQIWVSLQSYFKDILRKCKLVIRNLYGYLRICFHLLKESLMESLNFLPEPFTKNSVRGTHLKLDISEFQKIAQKHEVNPRCESKGTFFMKGWQYQCFHTFPPYFSTNDPEAY